MMRSIFLEGKKIYLSPLSQKLDLKSYASWLNDQDTTLYMGSGRFPATVEGLKEYIRMYNQSKDGILLGIFLKNNSHHIGNITLNSIDWLNRHAEIGIIVGDKKSRGKGYASEAIGLVVDHAFNKLNLHKLYAGMIEGNEASRKAFRKSGFKEEACLRDHFYLNGKYLGCHRMGLMKT
jgi:[ribosomal protein S5]-alanine N-acetyltransferase